MTDFTHFNEPGKPDSRPFPAHVFGAATLIIIGSVLLLSQTFGDVLGGSAWQIWLLIPVAGVLAGAYQAYWAAGGQMNGAVWSRLLWGLFPFVYIFGGSFGLDYALIWPIMVIAIGISMFVRHNTA